MSFDTPPRNRLTKTRSLTDALANVKAAICSTVGEKTPI